ncbi:SUKH-4 family immunity protein [Streptomyces sp. NPDC050610]|uniref:SUKH-4 family immunity protein n=1 Tax=Streptomyces sp. NPDC050610 TaxID=3157097 RepID=UPI00341909F7
MTLKVSGGSLRITELRKAVSFVFNGSQGELYSAGEAPPPRGEPGEPMVDTTDERWPIFSMVQIHGSSTEDPNWVGPGLTIDVPAEMVGYRYEADEALTIVSDMESGRFVKFGSNGVLGSTLLDTATGEVVQYVPGAGRVHLMNSSLPAFTETVKKFSERFPFYSSDSDASEIAAAAADVDQLIRHIDPPALVQDGFWATLIDDMEIGDFSTEGILDLA